MSVKSLIKEKLEKAFGILTGKEKQNAEVRFWQKEINKYIAWYRGELAELYGHPSPGIEKKVAPTEEIAAILTFFEVHQKPKYAVDLMLERDAFHGMKVLDIGSGPFPSGLCFADCELYCVDPLFDRYIGAGFPIHIYENRCRFVQSSAERLPFDNGFFDAVISVNAIDHVDDFKAAALEIKRVLKPGGKFRMHVHYHPKTTAEPIELNDEIFIQHYGWVNDLKRLNESKQKTGTTLIGQNEKYVVWGN